jgi:hypothetical protein
MRNRQLPALVLLFVLTFMSVSVPSFAVRQPRDGSREVPVIEKIVKWVKKLVVKPNDELSLPKP